MTRLQQYRRLRERYQQGFDKLAFELQHLPENAKEWLWLQGDVMRIQASIEWIENQIIDQLIKETF